MSDQETQSRKLKCVSEDELGVIISWLDQIEKSELSITGFFQKYDVPFSRAQYRISLYVVVSYFTLIFNKIAASIIVHYG